MQPGLVLGTEPPDRHAYGLGFAHKPAQSCHATNKTGEICAQNLGHRRAFHEALRVDDNMARADETSV